MYSTLTGTSRSGVSREESEAVVSRPFYERIDAECSSFTVAVPRNYCLSSDIGNKEEGFTRRRKFYLSELNIVPGFYSQKAFQLGVESDAAERKMGGPIEEYLMRIAINASANLYFDSSTGLAQTKFSQKTKGFMLERIVKEINDFFEAKKPAEISSTPFFIDWVDEGWSEDFEMEIAGAPLTMEEEMDVSGIYFDPVEHVALEDDDDPMEGTSSGAATVTEAKPEVTPVVAKKEEETPEAAAGPPGTKEYYQYYVKENAELYYGVDYSESLHYNSLPLSAASLPGVNNNKFPTTFKQSPGLRMRFNIAPMTIVQFSTNGLLESLGFTAREYGARKGKFKRFSIENPKSNGYMSVKAKKAPKESPSARLTMIHCDPYKEQYFTQYSKVVLTQEKFKSNAEIIKELEKVLETFSKNINMKISVKYSADNHTFIFTFPTGRVKVSLNCDKRLLDRIGYGPVSMINKESSPMAAKSRDGLIDAEAMSRALVMDTGMVVVTLDSSSAINTFGFDDHLMATLWPSEPGILTMKNATHQEDTAVRVPTATSGQAMVPVQFNVSTLHKNSEVSSLQWPIHCFAGGVLKGKFNGQ